MLNILVENPTLQKSKGRMKIFIAEKVISFIFLTVIFVSFAFSGNATTYYVSNSGNDSNIGTTPETAWKTINKVNNFKFAPGDQILFKKGGVWRERLTVPSSGTNGNPIVFDAYGSGENPIIDGADIISGMTSAGSNIWKKSGVTIQPYIMFLEGVIGKKKSSLGDLTSKGDWFYDSQTDVLSVYTSGGDPSGKIELGQRGELINVSSRNYVTVRNLTIQHSNDNTAGTGAVKSAFYMYQGSNILISGCTIKDNSIHGLLLINGSHLTVDNNVFLRNGLPNENGANAKISSLNQSGNDYTFSNNYSGYAGRDGVMIYATGVGNYVRNVSIHGNHLEYNKAAGAYAIRADKVAIYDNIINNNGDATNPGEDYGIGIQGGDNTDIYDNIITNQTYNDAVQVWATTGETSHNLRIFRNIISGVDDGDCLELITYNDQTMLNAKVYSNVFANASKQGITLSANGVGTVDTISIYNNTFYNNDQDIYKYSGVPALLRNNIFSHTIRTCVRAGSATNVYSNNNLWYKPSGNVLEVGGKTYTSSTITNYEATAQSTDPLFTDAANGNFTLQTGSPAIDTGTDVGLTQDINGNPIIDNTDIGAFELQKKNEDQVKYTTEDVSICEGDSYEGWTTSGQYERTLTAASGADSIVTTNLTVNPVYYISEDIYITEGESYNGWTETGEYERTLTSSTGCDSIVTTNLTVSLIKYTTEDISICEGNSYEGWTTSGQYERTLTAASGADSIVTTNLTVNPVYYISEDIYITEGESYNGWTETGKYERTLTSSTGCDSIVTTNLTVSLNKYTTEDISICEGNSYEGWTTSGQYERTLTAASGADSIVITILTVNPVYHITESIKITEGESYNGWTESGQYERTLTSSAGCDSIVVTDLIVEQIQTQTQTQTIYLEKGWNIFSSYVVPENTDMEVVLSRLQQENQRLYVEDDEGNVYEKTGNNQYNTIPGLESPEGYNIRVQHSGNLEITGRTIKLPLNIPLKKGMNIISFPYNGTADALNVLQPLIADGILEKVQDEKGNSIEYWGGTTGWLNGIGNFKAGEGYLVQVNQDGTLPILEHYEKAGNLMATPLPPEYFSVDYEGNGSGHMNINIENLTQSGLQAGDELAAYDGQICVGAVKLGETNIDLNATSFAASVSDTSILNGFTEGNPIEIRVWRQNKSAEITTLPKGVTGDMIYQKHQSIFINLLSDATTATDPLQSMMNINIYPNPASEQITLQFSKQPEPGTRIILSDLSGKILMIKNAASTREVLNVQSLSAGIYLIKTENGRISSVNKLIIK